MRPKNLKYLTIDQIDNLVTNIDTADLSSNFGLRTRGFRHIKPKTLGERDWGTIHRYGVYPSNITVVNGFTLFVPGELKDYEIIWGYDTASPPQMRCFVDDGTQVGNWTELTEFDTAIVTAISGTTATLGTFKDSLGNAIAAIAADYFKGFMCYPDGVATAYAGLVTTNTVLSAGSLTLTLVNKPDVALSWAVGNTIRLYRCTAILPDAVLGSGRGFVPTLGILPHFRFLDIGVQNKLNVFYGDSGGNAEGVKTVTGATNATPIVITVTAHGYSTGDKVLITGVTGNTNANGTWIITKVDANSFSLNGSVGNSAYISGGTSVKLNIAPTSYKQPLQIRKSGLLSPGSFTLGGAATGWASFANPDASNDIPSVATISGATNYVWVASGAKIYSANDGGVGTWTGWTLNTMPGGISNIKGIWMVDKDNGFACGLGGTVMKTTNGSAATPTWTSINTATIGTSDLYTVSAFDANTLWVAGASGKIFKTSNAGVAWTALTSNSTVDIYTIYFTDATHGQYGGQSTDGLGSNQIHFSTDGSTWSTNGLLKPPSGLDGIKSIYMVNNTTGFACGGDRGVTWYTSDGVNWTTLFAPGGNSVRGYDANTARVAGGGYVYKITNASNMATVTQTYDTLPDNLHTLYASSYYSQTSGFAVGQSGTVYLLAGSPGTMGSGPDTRFHVEKWGMLPDFVTWGSNTTFLAPSAGSTTKDIAEGIRITVVPSEAAVADGTQFYKRMYVTALYVDVTGTAVYQESDPIAQFFLSVSGLNKYPQPTVTMYVDPARVNKNLFGFRVYLSRNDIQKIPVANWVDDPKTYLQVYELLLTTIGWAIDTSNRYAYNNAIPQFTRIVDDAATASAPANISGNLGHTPVTVRVYMTPRYAVKIARSQGALIAVDQDDRTARLSAYNGKGVHMDDSFPNVSVDNNNSILQVPLLGRGELLGLAVLNDNLVSINVAEAQIFDLIKGFPVLLPIDCVSKRSISTVGLTDAPLGIVWQGKSNIYYMPRSGSSIEAISLNLKNFLDGTLLTSDNLTPFVTDDFRKAVIAGYDPTYNDVLFHIQAMKETPNVENITGASNASPIVITATAHSKNVNDLVYITGVQGNTAANGTWRVSVTTTNTFTIISSEDGTNSVGNGVYVASTGTAALTEYLTFRYNIQRNAWAVRYWSIGLSGIRSVKYFSRRNDNTLTLGYANGVLKYPNRDSSNLPYEDDVLITTDLAGNITGVTSQSRGIQTLLRINLGSIYGLEQNVTLWDFICDYSGSAKGDGDRFNIAWYINSETIPYDTKQVAVRLKMNPRGLGIDRGQIERAQLELTFPASTLTNFQRFEFKKIEIGVVPHTRIGNA